MCSTSRFTRRQWVTLAVFIIADFCSAVCISLQAPFYPQEAEKKGAKATEYGFVFGVFELVVFLVGPIYGQNLNRIGPKFLFNAGIFTTSVCCVLFGLLDKVYGKESFIALSFAVRILEAFGQAGFVTASFAIIANEFPDTVATTFASLETFFGLGLIVGPTLGGALYQIGGYSLPFVVLGVALFVSGIFTFFVLPPPSRSNNEPVPDEHKGSMLRVLRVPSVALAACTIIAASISLGFTTATLEPHMRQFQLSPVMMGLMFVVTGGTYAVTAPFWGFLCDRWLHPKVATIIGSILIAIGFSLLGPAPFVPLPTMLWLCVVALVLQGLGIGAELVAAFMDAMRSSVEGGFPDAIDTYGLISGMWTSTFAFGAFVGPSVAGVLFDAVGFNNGCIFVIVTHILLCLIMSVYLCYSRQQGDGGSRGRKKFVDASSNTNGLYGPPPGCLEDGSLKWDMDDQLSHRTSAAQPLLRERAFSSSAVCNHMFSANYGSLGSSALAQSVA